MFDKLAWQRKQRLLSHNKWTKSYEKTKKGFLMRLYRNMQSRVTDVQKAKYHLYRGKILLPREIFYHWAFYHPIFHLLFDQWSKNHYDRRLTPTVNRIDATKGYELENMEWITHSENSRLTSRNIKTS